ncbi:c-type cytochrome [Marinoscillum pacificum]|uniref:c-type cytochrome n=1 Tax=Marinoscillum pacificum TaxID=392723 RepID=UPI0021581AC0|nr:cytochrome c [Marinoscillum pacificum]
MKNLNYLAFACLSLISFLGYAQPVEEDYYPIVTIPAPEGVLLEVGGLTTLPDGRIGLSTRRGDVWVIENPYMINGEVPRFTLFASGLHESLGLAYYQNAFYSAQRGELTKLVDRSGDGRADVYETIFSWPLSGHYHEYSFGPKMDNEGNMYVTANVAFGDEEWWRGESRVKWRGWTMKISPDGEMTPWATGMRSPCGIGMIDGEMFYDDNQGDWIGSGAIWHVKQGSFTGHPAGLRWADEANSPIEVNQETFYNTFDERRIRKDGRAVKPANIQDEENPLTMVKAKETFPEITLPAVWLPHAILGVSNSEILKDETGGGFGPFAGQVFVGDQGQSKIMRVDLEEVNGEFQGVAFDFRENFQSGVLRMTFGKDGSLFVGETNRGWGSAGPENSGFERVVWSGKVPMEMKTIKAMPDGFEIEFTKPVDIASAKNPDSYQGQSFTYKYHSVYGSPTIENEPLEIRGVKVSDDGLKVRLVVDNLRQYFIHEINTPGIKSAEGELPVLHPRGYYTLNNIPEGAKLNDSELSKRPKKTAQAKSIKAPKPQPMRAQNEVLSYEQVMPLLQKNTCTACHKVNDKVVGPPFAEIAKRRYSNKRIVELIYSPEPQNWPNYATPMAPMPQVPKEEAEKIAAWINSLRSGD